MSSPETSCSCRVERPTDDFSSSEVPSATLTAAVDDRDPVGELVGLVEVLRGQQDRAALLHQLADRGPHLAAGARVEAGGRLVEEDQRGPGDQAGRQVEPATHAAGELGDLLGRRPPRARTASAGPARSRGPRGGSSPWRRPKSIRFSVAVRFSSTEAYCPVTPRSWRTTCGLRAYVDAEDARVTVVDREQRGEHLEHGGLAGAVGSQDAEHLAPVHGQVDAVDGALLAEVLDQAVRLDGGRRVPEGVWIWCVVMSRSLRCRRFHGSFTSHSPGFAGSVRRTQVCAQD